MRRWLGIVVALAALGAVALSAAIPVRSQSPDGFPSGVAAGDVTSDAAVLWTRTERGGPLTAEISADRTFVPPVLTAVVTPPADRGGMVKAPVSGLAPATRYAYRFRALDALSPTGSFSTAPAPDAPADLRLVFSGDADATRQNGTPMLSHAIFDTIAAERADLFLFLGDTIYSDSRYAPRPATTLDQYRAKYVEARAGASLRAALHASAVIAAWDDHEVENDFDRETVAPARFAAGLQAFADAWPIAEAGGRLYRSFRWGREVELIVLDLRSHRGRQISKTAACQSPAGGRAHIAPTLPPTLRDAYAPFIRQLGLPVAAGCLAALRDPGRTLLGDAQKQWLKARLAQSPATWKLVASQVPIQEFYAQPYDRWEGYAAERAEILTFIRTEGIRNVVWLSADAHAVLVNDVRLGEPGTPAEPLGMIEVVAGPLASHTFGAAVADTLGPLAVSFLGRLLTSPPPQGLGMSCAVLDRATYALVAVNSRARTLTITPKDAAGRPVCRAPVVRSATP